MDRTGWLYLRCGDVDKALSLFEASSSVMESILGEGDYRTVYTQVGKVMALHACGRTDEAQLLAQDCLARVDAALRCPRYVFMQLCLPTGA